MNIGQKLFMIGLSILIIITPCFAKSTIVLINGQQEVLDLYEIENRNYISLSKSAESLLRHGYRWSDYNNKPEHILFGSGDGNNVPENIIITKNNKTLTLSEEKGEILCFGIRMIFYNDYIPLATVTNYFGDSLEIPKISKLKETFLNQVDAIKDILTFDKDPNQAQYLYDELIERTINDVYFILLEKLPDNEKEELKQEQNEWKMDKDNGLLTREMILDRCYELILRLP